MKLTPWLVLGLAFSISVSAQEAKPDFDGLNDGDLLSEVTVTATRSRERTFNIPMATTVITKAQLQERGQTSMADLFKGETGVFVRATNPSAGSPIIRGVTGRDVLLLVDGFRLSHAFMRPNTQYEGLIDPFFTEQIDIVRGPSSVLYGSDAMGGLTNVLTSEFKPGSSRFQVHTDYLSNPAGISNNFKVNGGDEKFNVQASFTYRTFGDVVLGSNPDPKVFFPNPGRTVANSGYEYYGINFKSTIQLAANQTLGITAQYSRIPTVSRQDAIIQGYGTNVPSAERGFAPQSRTFVLGTYQATFENTWLDSLKFQMGFQQVEDNRYQRNFTNQYAFPNFNTGINSANSSLESNTSNLFGTNLQLSSTWGNNRLTYGFEAYFDQVKSTRSVANNLTGISPDANGPRYVDGSTLNQYGFYVQDETNWTDRFVTFLGLRYSSVDINVPFSTIRPNSSGFARNFQAFNGSFGARYRLTPEVNLVLNVGTGFRAPNINDLGEAGARRQSDINIPNSSLIAEKVFSIDGGVKVSGTHFTGELLGFWSQYTDRITSVSIGSQRNPDGTTSQIFQTQNRNLDTIWGLELGGRYRFNPQWSSFATGTFAYAEAGISGENAIPPFNGILGVRYEPAAGTYVEPFIRYAFTQNRLSANDSTDRRINPNGTPGWGIFNLRAGIPLNSSTTLRLIVDNIFNSTYREHSSTLDGTGTSISIGLDTGF